MSYEQAINNLIDKRHDVLSGELSRKFAREADAEILRLREVNAELKRALEEITHCGEGYAFMPKPVKEAIEIARAAISEKPDAK